MILDLKNPKLLKEITLSIIKKHPKMAKKHNQMLVELGKCYHDIHAEYHKGLYTFGIFQTLLVENPASNITNEQFDYLGEQLDEKHPRFIQFIIQSVFSESILSFRRVTDADKQSISIPNLHRKLEYIIMASKSSDENVFMCNLEKIKNKLEPVAKKTIKNYADLRIAHFDKRWETNMKNNSVVELKEAITLIKNYLNTFKRYYTGSAYHYFDEVPNACVNNQAKEGTEYFIRLIYGNKKYYTLKDRLLDFLQGIESYEIPNGAQENIKNKILEILNEIRNM